MREEKIRRKHIKRTVKALNDGKAAGLNRLSNEVWKYRKK